MLVHFFFTCQFPSEVYTEHGRDSLLHRYDTRYNVGLCGSYSCGGEVHQLDTDAIYSQCVCYRNGKETTNEHYLEMDSQKESTSILGEEELAVLPLLLHEGWFSVSGFFDRVGSGYFCALPRFRGTWPERVGVTNLGSCECASSGRSSRAATGLANFRCYDASFNNLEVSDDRCCGWKALQGFSLRLLGGMDAGNLRKPWGPPAGNFRHPTPTNCNTWVTKAWKNLKMDGVLKKAAELGMTPAPGPEVAGYEDKDFADVLPQGPEEEVVDEELWKDFMAQVEAEL